MQPNEMNWNNRLLCCTYIYFCITAQHTHTYTASHISCISRINWDLYAFYEYAKLFANSFVITIIFYSCIEVLLPAYVRIRMAHPLNDVKHSMILCTNTRHRLMMRIWAEAVRKQLSLSHCVLYCSRYITQILNQTMGSDASHLNLSPVQSHWLDKRIVHIHKKQQTISYSLDFPMSRFVYRCHFRLLFPIVPLLSLSLSLYLSIALIIIVHRIHSQFEFQMPLLNDFNKFNNNK